MIYLCKNLKKVIKEMIKIKIKCYMPDQLEFKPIFKGQLPFLQKLNFILFEPIYFKDDKTKELIELANKKLIITIEEDKGE